MRRLVVAMLALGAAVTGIAVTPVGATTPPPPTNGRILFTLDTKKCDDCNLKAIDPDGTDPFHYGGNFARWSPDGSRIAGVTETDDHRVGTVLMDSDGTNHTVFALPNPTVNANCAGAWSPDATTLLCEVWDDAHPNRLPGVFTADATDGSNLTRLTTNNLGGHDIPVDYSPDGTQIAFLRENPHRTRRHLALFVVGSDGSNPTRTTDWLGRSTCCTARYSPDGTVIAYGSGGKVRTVHPDGTHAGPIPIDVGKRIQYAFGPSWSPDGTKLVVPIFISPSFSIELFVTDADGSNPQMITDTPHRYEGWPDWGTYPTI
ncbi:MAG: hypothetical protein ABI869_05080 [Actinomycetota bacterium]